MYSKINIKPSKVSGKNPAMTKDDYPSARMKKTQQDLINEGKKFKFSVLKKPYTSDLNYQEMEYEATPLGRGTDMTPLAAFPRLRGIDTVPLIGDSAVSKYPCWCGGCTGGGSALGDTSEMWKALEQAVKDGVVKTQSEMKAWVEEHWADVFSFSLNAPTEYQCMSKDRETFYFYICGRQNEFIHLETTASDALFVESSFSVPFPDESKCTTIDRCVCHYIGVIVDCGAGFENCDTDRLIFISACKRTQAIKIRPSTTACSSLTIVDEGGGAATDTILRNGSNDYKTTGDCCEAITWSVGAGTGQLGGSTISSSGVLTAGATACGSLLVTAECRACGTSDTQYVKVTDGGQWVWDHKVQTCGTWVCGTCYVNDHTTCYDGGQWKIVTGWGSGADSPPTCVHCANNSEDYCGNLPPSGAPFIACEDWYEWRCP